MSFAFLLELLFTGFCFVRLALTGKLIKACPPFYVVWLILSQYLESFNNMIVKIEKKKEQIIIFFFKYYYFLYYFLSIFAYFVGVSETSDSELKKTHFYLLSIRYDFLFTFFESMQKGVCCIVVLSHHHSYYYFLFLVFCFYYYFVYIIIYFFVCF